MDTPLRVLVADDSEDDVLLLIRELKQGGYEPVVERVESENDLKRALHDKTWNLVISDYNLPQLTGMDVLSIFKETGLDIPFILVSGLTGEEDAVNTMKAGAHDYVAKENLSRLVPVINRELKEAAMRKSKLHSEEILRQSEERYRFTLDSVDGVYFEVDLRGRIFFFSTSLLTFLGYSEEELKGMIYRHLMDKQTAARLRRSFYNMYTTGTSVKFLDFEVIRKNGVKRRVEASVSLIRNANGRATGFRGICRDLAARKQVEEEILRSRKLESVGILAGGIAHDFNNLLSVILGYVSIAQTMINPDDEIASMLQKAEKAGFLATELTKRLITFSQGDDPWRKISYLEPLLKKAVDFSLVGQNVRFSYFIPDDLWPVNIDEGQIWQVVRNLVLNAGEAMPKGGIITISAENCNSNDNLPFQEGPCVKWSVTDQGIGIPPENLPRIFDPYFSTKDMGAMKGIGLGLAICHSIIRKHDGIINVNSTPGEGSTFDVYLPAFPIDAKQANAIEEETPKKKHRILVMDDEEDIRDMTSRLLKHVGYDVELTKDGDEAVDIYRKGMAAENPFSAVILDLTIKDGLGGKPAMKKLLQVDPHAKGIVITGYSDDPIVTNFRYHGFCAALTKPFTMKDIRNTLENIITGQR